MNKTLFLMFLMFTVVSMYAQNTFPSTGNVGIGTTSPAASLSFPDVTNGTFDGITWYNPAPLLYGIYKEAGNWVAPNYKQLKVAWNTGIILDPGTDYGHSYVDVRGGGMRISPTGISPVSNTTSPLQLNYNSLVGLNGAIFKNAATGSMAYTELTMYNDIDKFAQFYFSSSGYSSNPNSRANTAGIYSGGSGGISFLAGDPAATITLGTGNSNDLIIDAAGKVGIGTMAPVVALEVVGTGEIIRNPSPSGYSTLRLYNDQNSANRALEIDYSGTVYSNQPFLPGGPSGELATISTTGAYPLVFGTSNTARLSIGATGKVGIGTSSPDQMLTVNGIIHSKEVKVDLSVPAPDYVFENTYVLKSLDEVKTYINLNKHLPELPAATEMEKNGVNLSEMNMLLLKKIEEMTLYILNQEQRIRSLEAKLK